MSQAIRLAGFDHSDRQHEPVLEGQRAPRQAGLLTADETRVDSMTEPRAVLSVMKGIIGRYEPELGSKLVEGALYRESSSLTG